MFEKLGILLGSSFITCIITLLFNWAQNRKNNSLNYITSKREKWREKIKKVARKIEKCKYGEKNSIEQYLHKVEMNINPYGRDMQLDYKDDGHIWKTIEDIRNADNSDEFEKHKKLLLGYLSILLKEDWERSKREIKGYSNFIIYMIIELFVTIICSIFYFYILRLTDINVWLGIIILNVTPLLFSKWMFVDELDLMEDSYKREATPINKLRNKYKEKKVAIRWTIFGFVYILLNIAALTLLFPHMMYSQIDCKEKNDSLYIYTKLDTNIWSNLEQDVEKYIEKDVIILNEKENDLKQENIYGEIVLEILTQYMNQLVMAVFIFTIANISCGLILLAQRNYISRRGMKEADRLKKTVLSMNDMFIKLRGVVLELELDIGTDKNPNKEYINIVYRLLDDIEKILKNDINNQKYDVKSITSYKKIKASEELWQNVKEIIGKIEKYCRIKKINKKKKIEKQNEIMEEIIKDIREKVLCNLN